MPKMLTKSGKNTHQAIEIGILTKEHQPLPASWAKAVGLLRDKKKLLESHIKKVRSEWDR